MITDKLSFDVVDSKESFDTYKKMLTDRISRSKNQLRKLLSDPEKLGILEKVYSISVSDINTVITEMDLVLASPVRATSPTHVPAYRAVASKYFNVRLSNVAIGANEDLEANSSSTAMGIIPSPSENQIGFTLTKTDPFKKLVYNWYSTTKASYSGTFHAADVKALPPRIRQNAKSVADYLATIKPLLDKSPNYKVSDMRALVDLKAKGEAFITTINRFISDDLNAIKLPQYKKWVLDWLWYQNSILPSLNPFDFKAEDDLGEAPDTSALQSLRLKIIAREAFYKEVDPKKFNMRQIDSIINGTDSLKALQSRILNASNVFAGQQASNEKAIQSFAHTGQQLNEAIMATSKPNDAIYWMRHHDASVNYQLINAVETEEYLENDRVIILSWNLKPDETTALHLSFEDITNDVSQFTESLSPVIAQLTTAASGLAAVAAAGGTTPKNLDNLRIEIAGILQELLGKIEDLQAYLKIVDYLLNQTNPELSVEEKVGKSKSYRSEVVNPAKKIIGPKRAKYYMNTTLANEGASASVTASATSLKFVTDTFSYRVNKLYRFFPMAGFVYTLNNFTEARPNGEGQTEITESTHTRFIVGLKVYLRKTDIRSTKFISDKDERGRRLFLSRTSLNIAFDAKKPLQNIYVGPGFDLWPGFCVNLGCVANRYSFSVYNTTGLPNQTKTLYRPGFYLGLSTDISLFTDVAKFLNLSN